MDFKAKLVIFDLDGTLVEFPHEFLFSEAERILSSLSHPAVPRATLEQCFSDFDFFRFVEVPEKESFIAQFWESFNWVEFPKATPFEAAEPLCRSFFDSGVKLAIATARVGCKEKLYQELSEHPFAGHLSLVETREDEGLEWTDKLPQISRICQQLNIAPHDAMIIGDIPPDITSGKKAGLGCTVGVLSGGIKKEVLQAAEPDILVESIAELLR